MADHTEGTASWRPYWAAMGLSEWAGWSALVEVCGEVHLRRHAVPRFGQAADAAPVRRTTWSL